MAEDGGTTQWRFRVPPEVSGSAGRVPPSFSVVIPVYQGASFVGQAIECVLAQTTPAHEIIVVDDESTDEIEQAVAPYLDRITFVRIKHAGVAAARNEAVARATGDFLALLDVDDAFEPRFLEALGALSVAYPALDILTTDSVYERNGHAEHTFYERNEFPVDDQRRVILERCFVTTKTAVRRTAYLDVGGCVSIADGAEDWLLWACVILKGGRVGLVDAPLSRYRLHEAQATSKRAKSLAVRVVAAEQMLALDYISTEDRAVIERTLSQLRPRAAIAKAAEATGALTRRRRWLDLAQNPTLAWQLRLRGLVGVLTPGIAARRPDR